MLKIAVKGSKDKCIRYEKRVNKNCWIGLINPSNDEIERICKLTNIERDVLIAALDDNEKPRVEKEDDYVLVIVRAPFRRSENDIIVLPLGIVLTRDYIITICLEEIDVLKDFYQGKIKLFSTGKKNRFLLQILSNVDRHFIMYLDNIEKEIEDIEKRLLRTLKNEEVIKLLRFRKILTYFNTSIIANENVLEKILKGNIIKLYKEDEDVLEDIIIENKQAIEMVSIFTNILSDTMETFNGIISNNLNIVMKFLTSITIILSFPTIIASIYGMNIALPIQTSPFAFYVIMIFTLFLSFLVYYIFSKKGWI